MPKKQTQEMATREFPSQESPASLESARAHAEVVEEPAPRPRFLDFGDSALLFEVLFWAHNTFGVEFIKSDIRVSIDAAFRAKGITIPFPQRDLHIVSDQRPAPVHLASEMP